ncbi:urease accessory protein UreE [Mycolicibacterium goodii]|uniref:Urease accessory protein UreE n=1 Tax=Mycolicibacterium goodii TaxID=134601 RepID=A0ABS6HNG8_MYCGD|nr:urease accessory protein UreE [Mycolicibacterium goodii]MBU8808717.1 urease accessory protein UreE [Mycolicibacterium goodii]MBU8817377.1 urease accessory protein UreE [Mycolicibacterium goodii]MBU8824233.1 urease accessory protein UreE [Mycolicibacterium goodii]MBU8831296.1 urease accessory protein UreE [Mycolicibacterium goodii]MBU8837983.1 urease accessory protein UreE [Mycolicibacterium goodii]
MALGTGLRILDGIVGWATDAAIAGRLHELQHRGAVEYVHLDAHDLDRKRLRVSTDVGTAYAIVLPRDATLADGAVLLLDDDRAVVVRAGAPQTLTLRAVDTAAALRLGFVAGHLHWKVDQHGDTMVVRLQAPQDDYTARIADLLSSGRVELT